MPLYMTIHALAGGAGRAAPVAIFATWLLLSGVGVPRGPDDVRGRAVRPARGPVGRDTSARVPCAPGGRVSSLPGVLRETSGLALSGRLHGVLWTHNDSGNDPVLFAVDSAGAVVARVRVDGARNADWEALAQAPCAEGSCLYVADIGDNTERRREVVIYVVPEPAPEDSVSAPARTVRFRYPGGPRDAEALAAARGGQLYVISKGRGGASPVVYRLPAGSDSGGSPGREEPDPGVARARRLLELEDGPVYATGAAITPDGHWLAVRGYRTLRLFRVTGDGTLQEADGGRGTSLASLREPQGEAVAIRDDGVVFLTSEARAGFPAGLYRAGCRLPGR